jgi:hypothetical protein
VVQQAKAFHGKPHKQRLEAGTRLIRLATLADGFILSGMWWMHQQTFRPERRKRRQPA